MLKEFYINAQRFLVILSEEFGDYCLYCDYNGQLVIVDQHVEDIVEAKIMAYIYMYGF